MPAAGSPYADRLPFWVVPRRFNARSLRVAAACLLRLVNWIQPTSASDSRKRGWFPDTIKVRGRAVCQWGRYGRNARKGTDDGRKQWATGRAGATRGERSRGGDGPCGVAGDG